MKRDIGGHNAEDSRLALPEGVEGVSFDADDAPLELFVNHRNHQKGTGLLVVRNKVGIPGEISGVIRAPRPHDVSDDSLPGRDEIRLATRLDVAERIDDNRIVSATGGPETDDEIAEFQDGRKRSVEDERQVVDGHAFAEKLEYFEQRILIRRYLLEFPLAFLQVAQGSDAKEKRRQDAQEKAGEDSQKGSAVSQLA